MQKTHYWDNIAKTWQKDCSQTLWRMHSDAVNIALFSQWLPDATVKCLLKTDVFDEAFSEGLFPLFTSRANNVFGMDISTETLHAASNRHPGLQPTGADVRHLPFANGSLDIVVSNSTLDHFESPDEIIMAIRELHRILRSGGQLLITLDNLANPIIGLRKILPFRLLNRLGIVPYYVGATFGPRRLRRILQQTGFEIAELTTVMHCPRVLAVAISRLLENFATIETQQMFLRLLLACEHLSTWPTRFLTGYFVAAKAIKQ